MTLATSDNGYKATGDARLNQLIAHADPTLGDGAVDALLAQVGKHCDPPATCEEALHALGAKRESLEQGRNTGPLLPDEDLPRIRRLTRNIVPWPQPVGTEARHGLAGRALEVIEPHSEADPHALLVSLLVMFGNAVGRGPGFQAEGDFHATNEKC